MKDLNSVFVIGRLTKDAAMNGDRCEFSIGFNTTKKDHSGQWVEESNYLNLALFGNHARNLLGHLRKGVQVAVSGHLKQNRWEKDGQKYSALNVMVDDLQVVNFQSHNKKDDGKAQAPEVQSEPPQYSQGELDYPDDIPF